jgi:hypothetical protein
MTDFQNGVFVGVTAVLIVLPLIQWWYCRSSKDSLEHPGQVKRNGEWITPIGMEVAEDLDVPTIKFSHWIIGAPLTIGSLMAIGFIIGTIVG